MGSIIVRLSHWQGSRKLPQLCYDALPQWGGSLGILREGRGGQRSRTVREDWFAWIPNEMDQLFDATRNELESSNALLSITLNEAISLCKEGQFGFARERAIVFAGLFDRLAIRVCHVIRVLKDHGSRFGTLPHVAPLAPANFRGELAQRVSFMNQILAKVLFRQRTRFFHKLYSLDEIVAELQKQASAQVGGMSAGDFSDTDHAWQQLEVLGYDLNTCMKETTILLKSFFCALPFDQLAAFQEKLAGSPPAPASFDSGRTRSFHRK